MELQLLQDLTLPLDRVSVQAHSLMKGVVGAAGGFLTPAVGRVDPRKVALAFTRANSDLLGRYGAGDMQKDAANARADASLDPGALRRSPGGYHVQLQQSFHGIPVYGGRLSVHMTRDRGVYSFTNDMTTTPPDIDVSKAAPTQVSCEAAMEVISARLHWQGRLHGAPRCNRVFLPVGEALRLAWCADLNLTPQVPIERQDERSADWRVLVDAQNGEVLRMLDLSVYADAAHGRVFYPNPVVALHDENLSCDSVIPDSAYRTVNLLRLDSSGFLRGRYADTEATPHRVQEASGQFLYDRSQAGFEEVMAYFFVDQVMDWLRRRGWPTLFDKPLCINVHAPLGDNSKFLPWAWALYLGEGKVEDAEDASIIIHELGHAIQEAQVTDWAACDPHLPVRAMGEGFADWLATLFFAEERRKFHQGLVGDWDAHGYEPPAPSLRQVNSPKTMTDWAGEEHADGEIWSAALWDLYLKLGGDSPKSTRRRMARNAAVNLVLTSHQYLSDGRRETLTFQHGLQALLDADRFTSPDPRKPGPHEQLIRDVFVARGIFP